MNLGRGNGAAVETVEILSGFPPFPPPLGNPGGPGFPHSHHPGDEDDTAMSSLRIVLGEGQGRCRRK